MNSIILEFCQDALPEKTKQGVYKFNQANFQEISRRDFKKNPGHVCLASASFGGDT